MAADGMHLFKNLKDCVCGFYIFKPRPIPRLKEIIGLMNTNKNLSTGSIGKSRDGSPHDVVMSYLQNHDEITNRIVRDLTGIGSENVVKQVFLDLNDRKMLERVPGKRGNASAWRKYTGYWERRAAEDEVGDA